MRPVVAQNGGTPAHDSGGAQLGGFIQNPRSCESQRANSKAVREDPPRRASGMGLDSVNAIFSLNYTLKPAKGGAGALFKERFCCPLLVKILSSKLQAPGSTAAGRQTTGICPAISGATPMQKAHCDHKPRAAWVFMRLLLHRRSAVGWAGCVIYSTLVSFSPAPVFWNSFWGPIS